MQLKSTKVGSAETFARLFPRQFSISARSSIKQLAEEHTFKRSVISFVTERNCGKENIAASVELAISSSAPSIIFFAAVNNVSRASLLARDFHSVDDAPVLYLNTYNLESVDYRLSIIDAIL